MSLSRNKQSSSPINNPKNDEKNKKNINFHELNFNENYRYLPSSKTVGHAVITNDNDGNKVALQFNIPNGNNNTTKVCPLTNIEEFTRFGKTCYKAETADDQRIPMYATRYVKAKTGQGQHERDLNIACFSPRRDDKEPFWGSDKEVPLFRDDLTSSQEKKIKETRKSKKITKGGNPLIIDPNSVVYRDANKTRNPSQNTVMGESALNAYQAFLDEYNDELSPKMKAVLEAAVEAPLHNLFKSQRRPEWLHGYGYSLTPKSVDPQRKDNLGAAPKWANTEMMVLERIAKWFALNQPDVYIAIKPHFEMLLDSELIKHIHFEVTLQDKENWITFLQDIDPFKEYPLFRKPSDLAQSTVIAHNILNNIKPASEQKIASSNTPSVTERPNSILTDKKKTNVNQVDSTNQNHAKSIVKIMTTSHEPDYDEPWLGSHIVASSGTGLIIKQGDEKYILTNAHCVENGIRSRVRLANHRKVYETTRVCVSYQCDLALLKVADPEFNQLTEHVEFGEMVNLEQSVQTIGFPMGGNEISISQGIVSRIEVQEYVMSNLDMLQVQVDAAINPGNSGGPVFSNGKVVGVAFQGYGKQGLGYMIPMPIINHFLTEAFNEQPYRGFPALPIALQPLKNPLLKKYYGLSEDQTGMRISRVDKLCDAYDKLKTDDIVLAIDSLPISDDGKIDIADIGKCIDWKHIPQMKYIGDTVTLTVLRNNPETDTPEILQIPIILDHIPLETKKVPQAEHDKMPTYYIASGVSFVPLTRNYMLGRGAEFEDFYLIEEGCFLGSISKKTDDEQIIVISDVLDCEENEGYRSYENRIVKEINGKTINNIRDVIDAIENNTEAMHKITTPSKRIMILKNMSPAEHAKLLHQYHIAKDRSEDLLTPVKIASSSESEEDIFKSSTTSDDESYVTSDYESMECDVAEDTSDEEINFPAPTPGSQRLFNTIQQLEKKYKDNNDDDSNDFVVNAEKQTKENNQKHNDTHRLFKKRTLVEDSQLDKEIQHKNKKRRIV